MLTIFALWAFLLAFLAGTPLSKSDGPTTNQSTAAVVD